MTTLDLAVIGGGPAGLAAAVAAAECGVRTRLVDENPQLGGQYYRSLPPIFRQRGFSGGNDNRGRELIDRVRALEVDVHLETVVWGVFDRRILALARGRALERIEARAIVFATGAYDRPVPFPGWTLPGVLTAGGAQNLMKGYGVLPGRRVLVAGSGPLTLVVAHYLLAGGARVGALCEAGAPRASWRNALRLLPHMGLIRQGYGYWRELKRANVPMLTRHIIRRALGETQVAGAVVSACDGQGLPIAGTERRFDADAIVISYGLVPTVDLPRLAGCAYRYAHDIGGWVPVLDDHLESTVPGVFVAGEGSGVAGSAVAVGEGRLAGLAAARHLGRISEAKFRALAAPGKARLRRLAGFRAVMDELYRVQPGLYSLMDDETVVCRCEEVKAAAIMQAIGDGARVLNEVKLFTRAGMGRCQGRMCGPAIAGMIARTTGCPLETAGVFTARIPARPVSLAAFSSVGEAAVRARRGREHAPPGTMLEEEERQ